MKYIDLINNYWKLARQGIVSKNEGYLYLYLVDVCNGLIWKNPFNQPTSTICKDLGITKQTLHNYRNKLKEVGLIDFIEGSTNTKPPIYILILIAKANKLPITSSTAFIAPIVDIDAEETVGNEEPVQETVIERPHQLFPEVFTAKELIGSSHISTISMVHKIPIDKVQACLVEFLKDRESDQQTYPAMHRLVGHFQNYCKKNYKTIESAQTTSTVKIKTKKL